MLCKKKETKEELRYTDSFDQNNILLLQVCSENKIGHFKRVSFFRNILSLELNETYFEKKDPKKYKLQRYDYIQFCWNCFINLFLTLFCCCGGILVIEIYRNSFFGYSNIRQDYLRQNILISNKGIFVYWKKRKHWGKWRYLLWFPCWFFAEKICEDINELQEERVENFFYSSFEQLYEQILLDQDYFIKEEMYSFQSSSKRVFFSGEIKNLMEEKIKEFRKDILV
eukprot:snap_masked-scaffold_17-processed-gene-6.52-mRNA-1 protein AED:1.00 eAED:1.00 QI:0/0/0/0/1/1/2/0/225